MEICKGCDAEIHYMTHDTKPLVVCGSCAVRARIASAREGATFRLSTDNAQRYADVLSLSPKELGDVLMHAIDDYNLRPVPRAREWFVTVAMVAATALAKGWPSDERA